MPAARAMGAGAGAGADARVRVEARLRDADIAFYERRVRADAIGAADRARLAALYLQRARETGDFEDYRRAERLARRSLALRLAHNDKTYALLAATLLAQHRFTEARDVARTLNARDPGVPSQRALLAEVELELGRYAAAGALFDSLWPARHELSVAPRLARWAEIRGDTALARRLLDGALAAARQRRDLPAEQLAWFHLRVGDFALRYGRLDAAEYALRRGLDVFPGDYRLLAALARVAASRGRWRDAVAYGDQAIAGVADPATFGIVSDAYAAQGDTARAAEYARAMEIAVLGQPGQWHRAWSLFLLEHHRRLPEVLAKVREELRTRRDVYGYDLLAWALHQAGRDAAAREPMARALALGTLDPQLLRHAAAIARARP
jgi:tetratricopeptide (TPR) repeat protein